MNLSLLETANTYSSHKLPVALLVLLEVSLGNKVVKELLSAQGVLLLGLLYFKSVLEFPVLDF